MATLAETSVRAGGMTKDEKAKKTFGFEPRRLEWLGR